MTSIADATSALPEIAARDSVRRLKPSITHTDWLVLRRMEVAIRAAAAKIAAPGQTAIDFGCGDKPYEAIFKDLGCVYRGADLGDLADIEIEPTGHLRAADKSAEMVLSFQVLEHVRDLGTYFSEARRVLAADGWLLLSTHGSWLYHPHPEDHRRWTRQGLIAEIEDHGFTVTECVSLVGPLAWTTMLRLTCWSFALKKIPLVGGILAGAMAVFMNVRAVLEDAITPKWVSDDNACVYVTLSRIRAGD